MNSVTFSMLLIFYHPDVWYNFYKKVIFIRKCMKRVVITATVTGVLSAGT